MSPRHAALLVLTRPFAASGIASPFKLLLTFPRERDVGPGGGSAFLLRVTPSLTVELTNPLCSHPVHFSRDLPALQLVCGRSPLFGECAFFVIPPVLSLPFLFHSPPFDAVPGFDPILPRDSQAVLKLIGLFGLLHPCTVIARKPSPVAFPLFLYPPPLQTGCPAHRLVFTCRYLNVFNHRRFSLISNHYDSTFSHRSPLFFSSLDFLDTSLQISLFVWSRVQGYEAAFRFSSYPPRTFFFYLETRYFFPLS